MIMDDHMEENVIKQDLRDFIVNNYMAGGGTRPLEDDDSFLDKGIIDSIGVIELVHFIQDKYSIRITVPEIVPENFDTLDNLSRYILSKKGTGGDA